MASASQLAKAYNYEQHMLLEILRELQKDANYLTEQNLKDVAHELNLPFSHVYGVASFYSLYSTKPRGQNIIRLCENAPCHIDGAQKVLAALEQELGVAVGQTTGDGKFTLELTSCLGVCAVGPAMMINSVVYGHLTPEKVAHILARY